MLRKDNLENNQTYHIFTRSIAEFRIFNYAEEFERMINLFQFFSVSEPPSKFSRFLQLEIVQQNGFQICFDKIASEQEKIVSIIAYCLMPTHFHLTLKQLKDGGISSYVKNVLDSYTRFFNLKHKRKGPLWEGRFKSKLLKNDEQLLHLTRYIHLNPVTATLVEKPEDWVYSSYREYISEEGLSLCHFSDLMEIVPTKYKKFVYDRIGYQRELAKIKALVIE